MMEFLDSRYNYTGLKTVESEKFEYGKESTKRRFGTSLMPAIPESDGDVYIVSRQGDRLDLLSKEYYGTPYLWWYIAHANGIGKGGWAIEPGLTLRIPVKSGYTEQIAEVSSYNNGR